MNNDEQFIKNFQKGEWNALSYAYRSLLPPLQKKIKDADLAHQVLQESIIKTRDDLLERRLKFQKIQNLLDHIYETAYKRYLQKQEEIALDKRIIECLLNNDGWAYYYMQRRYFPSVTAMILLHGGTEEDAKDIIMDAIYVLLKNIREGRYQVQVSARLKTYFIKICKNLWYDHLKQKKRNATLSLDNEQVIEKVDSYYYETLEDDTLLTERQRIIEEIFLNSTDKCRELLKLFYYERLSHEEIAQRMGYANANSSKTQKLKCLRKLKILLRNKGYFSEN